MKIQNYVMMALIVATQLGFLATPVAQAAVKHHGVRSLGIETNKNLVLWCGAANALEQSRFPYLAAIRNYRSAKGMNYDVATVYKKGKVVFRQYVYHNSQHNQLRYEASSEEFSLKFKGHGGHAAELKARVHDEDGVKLIAAGSITCAKPKRG